MRESTLKTSVLLRVVLIGVLAIVLLIPTLFVGLLVSDRQASRAFAVREVTEKWGTAQTIVGPILTVPVTHLVKNKEGEFHPHTRFVRILPERLDVKADIAPEIRRRGIYDVALYTSRLNLEADFDSIQRHVQSLAKGDIGWDKATVTVGITDLKGIREIHSMTWNDRPLSPESGLRAGQLLPSALTAQIGLSPEKEQHHFSLDLDLRGSEELRVVPSARETKVNANSPWADPSFVGDFLPENRQLTGDSFTASWHVLEFNRNLPQSWVGDEPNPMASSFGVKLLLPVDEYQKTFRALKYAIMFIALTFLAFFVLDVLTKSPFHPVQYTLIGLALILFYVLLLSVSEYLTFNTSYWISSASIIGLIASYTRGITRQTGVSIKIGTHLVVLYGFLFVLLQLEDYALLLGSLGLFAILGTVMYITRRVDWFSLGGMTATPPQHPMATMANEPRP